MKMGRVENRGQDRPFENKTKSARFKPQPIFSGADLLLKRYSMKYLPSAYRQRAEKLAVMYLDDNKVPTRFKSTQKGKNFRKDSDLELNFQEAVQDWINLMEKMMERDFPQDLIHQLIYLQINEDITGMESVTESESWEEYNQYLTYLRDEVGDDMELGRFSMLFHAWQGILERKMDRSKGLKNDLAQELMDKGEIEIDGIVIKIWKGHSRDSVAIQQDWNRLGSIGAMNLDKPKDSPKIVFTGMFQIPRAEVAQLASDMGFRVQGGVNSQTQIVVFGTENVGPNKIADLIELRRKGQEIEILEENAFLEMALNGNFSQIR
jgi:hypothetical protein